MAKIQISDLSPASESYLNELTDAELNLTKGGDCGLVALALVVLAIIFS